MQTIREAAVCQEEKRPEHLKFQATGTVGPFAFPKPACYVWRHQPSNETGGNLPRVIIQDLLSMRTKLGLRTKFILSLVLVTAGRNSGTPLSVVRSAGTQVQREVEEGARNPNLNLPGVHEQ